MEKEDPLERLERIEREKKENGGLKSTMWVLAAITALLAIMLAVVWIRQASLIGDLKTEKEDLTQQIIELQSDYDNLSSDYDAINSQLDSSREEIAQLVDRIKKTDATNRAKIRQYEKELGTLRSIMRNYIVQIDSLNSLNKELTAVAAKAKKEAAKAKIRNEELKEQVQSLEGQVAAGSVLKARAIRVEAYTTADKLTDKSTKTAKLLVSLALIENELAEKGPTRIFVKITGPDGNEIPEGNASREVDYEGAEVEMSIYVNNIVSFTKGIYTATVYTGQGVLGSAELMLR